MKSKILLGGLLVVMLSIIMACNPDKKEAVIDKDQIKAEIRALENNLAATFNNRDINLLDYYAEDAISYFGGQEPVAGLEEIHRHIENEILNLPEGATITFEPLEIYVADDGNHVAEIGAHQLLDSTGVILQKGHYMSFFAKKDGKYLCTRDMANSVQYEY